MPKRKIVEIKPQVRNPQRKTLVFDDGSVFGISEDVFISNNFKVNDEISDKSYEELVGDELRSKVFNSALRLLGYRMRSCTELRGRLLKKKYPSNIVEDTIDKLLKMKYLNDTEFAQAFAHDKVNNKKIGPIVLRKEFISHKIDEAIVNEAIDEVYKKYPISDIIKNLLNKKKILPGIELDQKSKKRIIDLLVRKGFKWDNISAVFSEMNIKI